MITQNSTITIIGAGRMGRGIAHVFAYSGYQVHLVDMKERNEEDSKRLLHEALDEIKTNLLILSSVDIIQNDTIDKILNRIQVNELRDLKTAVSKADVIFEAVPEIINVKKDALKRVCKYVSDDTLIASTTSTFSVSEIAKLVSKPKRFLNTHWLNPAYLIPLVEISPSDHTDKEVLNKMTLLLKEVGKVPVTCAASPGFIVPRLQALTMNEAARLVEENVASVEDIDKAVKTGFGLRFAILGLLEFIDWGGGDTLFYASNYLKKSLKDERFSPPDIISKNMENGTVGIKSGKGFYDFQEMDISNYQKETILKFIDLLNHLGFVNPPADQ